MRPGAPRPRPSSQPPLNLLILHGKSTILLLLLRRLEPHPRTFSPRTLVGKATQKKSPFPIRENNCILSKIKRVPSPCLPRTSSPQTSSPSFADPRSGRIVLLADDLTGACDAAAAFIRSGRSVRVWFGASVQFSAPESVQAFNTNSRSLSPGRAERVVSQAATALGSDPNSLFFKKVDSAARGPFAAEVLAAHRALSTRAILLAPAFPSAGRIVRDGVLELQDAAGKSAQIRLAGLFPLTSRSHIGQVSQPSELAPMLDSGHTILLCDSTTEADLDALARAAQDLSGLLYAGSAGLAHALSGLNRTRPQPALLPPVSRTLLIAGSPHPVTKLQLENLESDRFDGVQVLQTAASIPRRHAYSRCVPLFCSASSHPHRRRNCAPRRQRS